MKITEHEMRGLLTGKCVPADMLVNETLSSYLVRKFFESEDTLRIKRNHITLRDGYIAELEGDNEELKDELSALQQKLDAANAELARYSMPAGQADQYAAEAKAVRKALGFAENAEDVAPVDLLEKVAGLRAEGIYFAANRMLAAWDSGFIDDTPAQAYDISGAVLSAVEFLPDASPEDFKRDFADSIRAEIAAKPRAETDTTSSQYESLAGGK